MYQIDDRGEMADHLLHICTYLGKLLVGRVADFFPVVVLVLVSCW